MATVNQFFGDLLDNLKLRDYQDDLVKERGDNLYKRLREMDGSVRAVHRRNR